MRKEIIDLKYNVRNILELLDSQVDDLNNNNIVSLKKNDLNILKNAQNKITFLLKLNKKNNMEDNIILKSIIYDSKGSEQDIVAFLKNNQNVRNLKRYLIYLIKNDKFSKINDMKLKLKKYKELKNIFLIIDKILK
jgi:hypothetical protein